MQRLKAAWAKHRKLCCLDEADMPISPLCALAQYVVHCIAKMNANLGFGLHVPGVGRSPTSQRETEKHFEVRPRAMPPTSTLMHALPTSHIPHTTHTQRRSCVVVYVGTCAPAEAGRQADRGNQSRLP